MQPNILERLQRERERERENEKAIFLDAPGSGDEFKARGETLPANESLVSGAVAQPADNVGLGSDVWIAARFRTLEEKKKSGEKSLMMLQVVDAGVLLSSHSRVRDRAA